MDDTGDDRYTIFLHLPTSEILVDEALKLLKLIEIQPEMKAILSACATVALAAALDQGTKDVLTYVSAVYAMNNDINENETPYASLLSQCLRKRMMDIVDVLTENRFVLNHNNPTAGKLHELITHRNKLMHLDDDLDRFTKTDNRVTLDGDHVSIKVKVPESPWSIIDDQQARGYYEAVNFYFKEVLYPPDDIIVAGELVIPRT